MATVLVQPPIPAFHANIPPMLRTTNMVITHTSPSTTHQKTRSSRFGECPPGFRPIYRVRVAEQTSGLVGDETPTQIKTELYQALKGMCLSSVSFHLSSTFKPYFDEHFESKLKWVDTNFYSRY